MKHLRTGILVMSLAVLTILGIVSPPVRAHGTHKDPISSGYNARIIDDYIFTKSDTMSTDSIQSFLNAKVPVCRSGYTCLKDYQQGGKSAAQIIYKAAQDFNLNPRVILVTLQKEQSLVTDDWPVDAQYRTAMGYGCPESESTCNSEYYGFTNQVRLGTKLLRVGVDRNCGNMDSYPGWSVNSRWRLGNTTTVDGKDTKMGTCATGSLYNYTPHRPDSAYMTASDGHHYYGNYNFIYFFSNWFGNPLIDPNKDKVLVGDWDGDGRKTPAIRRGNTYYFDNNSDGDIADAGDKSYSWGKPTDRVLIGRWNGLNDGIGLKRGREYFLDYDNNGSSNKYLSWGKETDQVLVGDWYGSVSAGDKLGLKRGNYYFFDFDNNAKSDVSYAWGRDTDQALVGSWYGSGGIKDKLGLKRGNYYFFDFDNNAKSDVSYAWGRDTDQALVGNWYNSSNGRVKLGLKRGNYYFFDFDNNAKSDVSYAWGRDTDQALVGNWYGASDGKDGLGLKRGNQYFLDYEMNASSSLSYSYTY